MEWVLGILIGLVVGGGAVFGLMQMSARNVLARARQEAEHLRENTLKEAQNKAKEIELQVKQQQLKEKLSETEAQAESLLKKVPVVGKAAAKKLHDVTHR